MMLTLFAFLTLAGVLAHFLKRKIKGETLADIKTYFATHVKSTVLTLLAATAAFFTLYYTGELSGISAFMAGYTTDSILNRNDVD
jgi:hypothetical protein